MPLLSGPELRQIYEVLVKPMAHPDPIGYMTRAILTSGGDPDYFGHDNKLGFMPVSMEQVVKVLGQTTDISSLQGNILTTLTMDKLLYEQFMSIDSMIIAFHFGEEMVDSPTGEATAFINDVNAGRSDMTVVINPPRATVKDVVQMLSETLTGEKGDGNIATVIKEILEK